MARFLANPEMEKAEDHPVCEHCKGVKYMHASKHDVDPKLREAHRMSGSKEDRALVKCPHCAGTGREGMGKGDVEERDGENEEAHVSMHGDQDEIGEVEPEGGQADDMGEGHEGLAEKQEDFGRKTKKAPSTAGLTRRGGYDRQHPAG